MHGNRNYSVFSKSATVSNVTLIGIATMKRRDCTTGLATQTGICEGAMSSLGGNVGAVLGFVAFLIIPLYMLLV